MHVCRCKSPSQAVAGSQTILGNGTSRRLLLHLEEHKQQQESLQIRFVHTKLILCPLEWWEHGRTLINRHIYNLASVKCPQQHSHLSAHCVQAPPVMPEGAGSKQSHSLAFVQINSNWLALYLYRSLIYFLKSFWKKLLDHFLIHIKDKAAILITSSNQGSSFIGVFMGIQGWEMKKLSFSLSFGSHFFFCHLSSPFDLSSSITGHSRAIVQHAGKWEMSVPLPLGVPTECFCFSDFKVHLSWVLCLGKVCRTERAAFLPDTH